MITGSLVALVTPMREDGAVDHESLAKVVDRAVEAGTAAIVSVGTTGESATLDVAEHTDVIRRTIEVAAGRVPVIAGTGANSTAEAIHLTAAAKAAGADAALLVTPYYNKPPQEGLYRHFKAVAEAVDLPQILYNVPGRTACDMLPSTVERLAAVPNIVGLKEALGDLDRVRDLVALDLPDFALYSGDDATARASILAGFHGDISVTANVAPEAMARMCAAALAGEAELAAQIDADLAGLHRSLFAEPNPIPVKWALAELGLIPPGIRLPLVPLDPVHHEDVRAALRSAGLLS
ncbi:4-hydroxy-tetrahydrodipicolinate synthase [Pseudonocardia sp. KRD-184]|uniref:4-hydroxy-tetrahydrodipicolinate synthase n=1 Tax=Pseudonocardia oceani TaxID=2792013 RepID=A0ABS6U568_9PSEU|nr:4-hydroxy-tetrahydrodipicolinate synthase [Pseudonocardia oceani]MBW0092609.1 4-hydroxy-tetrahydrodipicolinate synthase [Pseudonocardia oceani]MBW0099437.1 4-hydroxy-tetrahydrodipicolinate synthase [Pseudonocardia oceani]MBW0111973.1 4-hydroxy-tetrahydrodipicolinate synthase [Pseudonocardia oceani]MBW0124972.1 4-hydroxy-tetrahydrodipicolinate synthase [Pseudonocardia oceani]MBW0127359.1 4-hydroxy-tetrahydrodipicolinate synthase [Pseudonocardia oceani]